MLSTALVVTVVAKVLRGLGLMLERPTGGAFLGFKLVLGGDKTVRSAQRSAPVPTTQMVETIV